MLSKPLLRRFLKLTGVLFIALAPAVCVAGILQQVSPTPTTYAQGTDFFVLTFSGAGNVTAQLQAAGGVVLPPTPSPSSSSGCAPADFAGFVPGRIALIQRGTCTFAAKVANAAAAGAAGVLIFNEGNPGRTATFEGTLGGPGAAIPAMTTGFSLGQSLYNEMLSGPVIMHMEVGGTLASLSPAKLWIGLKNSDAVGLRVDLFVTVDNDGAGGSLPGQAGQGLLLDQATGSSGFNNALLKTIGLVTSGRETNPGDVLSITAYARRTCSSAGGHNSGAVRLWYNGQAVDSGSGRDAGSRFDATIGANTNYFLRNGFALDTAAGSSRLSVDAPVNSSAPCTTDPNTDRPYVPIGTWSRTLP